MASDDRIDELDPAETPLAAGEREEAGSFASLIDRLVDSGDLPAALRPEERALAETAAMVRASARVVPLEAARQSALIEEAMARAMGHIASSATASRRSHLSLASAEEPVRSPESAPDARPEARPDADPAARPGAEVVDLGDLGARRRAARRQRLARVLPWAVAMTAAAAALILALRPLPDADTDLPARPLGSLGSLARVHRSRPADSLVGEIPRNRAGAASDRIDMIYADRLIGYRDLRLRGGRP